MTYYLSLALFFVSLATGCAPQEPSHYYAIETPQGRMVVRLYNETPLHRDNFAKLVAEAYYDSTRFHRIIDNFMIQGGDPNSRDDNPHNDGQGGPDYTVPAEFNPALYHKRGALAAAREGDPVNPEQASSGSQFYLVKGQVFTDTTLSEIEEQIRKSISDPSFAFTADQRAVYTTDGGTPFLDRQYTVFGELVEGFDVLDRIAAAPTPRSTRRRNGVHPALADQPFEPVPMTVRALPDYEEK